MSPRFRFCVFGLLLIARCGIAMDSDGDYLLDSEEGAILVNQSLAEQVLIDSGTLLSEISAFDAKSLHPSLSDYAWLALHFEAGTFAASVLQNDTDSDGIPDWVENQFPGILDPENASDGLGDLDNNGILNFVQFELGMPLDAESAGVADADGDGVSDAYEAVSGMRVSDHDAAGDLDGDGLFNFEERSAGTSPVRDHSYGKSRRLAVRWYDIQGEGESLQVRIFKEQTGEEAGLASDYEVYFEAGFIWQPVSDWPFEEGIPSEPLEVITAQMLDMMQVEERPDYQPVAVSSPVSWNDWDGDGLANEVEYRMLRNHAAGPFTWRDISLALRDPDMNQDGVPDGAEDWDGDGLSNLDELSLGTLPWLADSDADSVNNREDPAPLDSGTSSLLLSITAPVRGGTVQ